MNENTAMCQLIKIGSICFKCSRNPQEKEGKQLVLEFIRKYRKLRILCMVCNGKEGLVHKKTSEWAGQWFGRIL